MRIVEIFYSVQGEGSLSGIPTVFVRLSGCNLRCCWCDTRYSSWEPEYTEMTISEVMAEIKKYNAKYVAITGGEPMLSKELPELVSLMKNNGMHITIETNGTLLPNGIGIDLASLSPKLSNSEPDAKMFPNEYKIQQECNRIKIDCLREWIKNYDYQLKFVVSSIKDLEEIQTLLKQIDMNLEPAKVMLMPEGKDVKTLHSRDEMLVEMCKKYGYRYCRRLHVDIFGDKRGV